MAALQDVLRIEAALDPGRCVDASASFVFTHVAYVDTDRRCPAFGADPRPVL